MTMKLKIKKGDTVYIQAGKDRGKEGKVIRVLSKAGKIVVENINLVKKHQRKRTAQEKSAIITKPMPFSVSRAMFVCPRCSKRTRIGFKIVEEQKFRVCKQCGQEI